MAEDVNPTKTLAAAKEKLIEERRMLAVAIALAYKRRRTDDSHNNETRGAFIEVQNLIEAIDRAIAHEKLVASGAPAYIVVPEAEIAPSDASCLESRQ